MLLIFADRHKLAVLTYVLTHLLPFLKQQDYSTLCIEDYFPDNKPMESVVERKREIFRSTQLFLNGNIPTQLNREQKVFLKHLQEVYVEPPKEMMQRWHLVKEGHQESLEWIVSLYEKAQEQGELG